MDNKSNNTQGSQGSFSNFLKKESFYVVLFITLCIVAAIAAITINSKKVAKNKVAKNIVSKTNDTNSKKPDNALLVEGEKEKKDVAKKDKKEEVKVYKSGKKLESNKKNSTASVSNNMDVKFIKPIEGEVVQGYSEIPVLAQEFSDESTKTYKTNLGVNIQSKVGNSVKAAASGVVEEIGENPKGYGNMVVIDHKNGFKTVYSNLDGKVSVKKGDSITQGQEIGKLGDTTLRTSKIDQKKKLSYLHFSMLKGNGKFKDLDYKNKYINPDKFIK